MNGTNNTIISHFNSEVLMIHDSGLPPSTPPNFINLLTTLWHYTSKKLKEKKNLHICTHAVWLFRGWGTGGLGGGEGIVVVCFTLP